MLRRCLDSVPAQLSDMRSMIDPKLLQEVLLLPGPFKPRPPLWEPPSLQNGGSDPQTPRHCAGRLLAPTAHGDPCWSIPLPHASHP